MRFLLVLLALAAPAFGQARLYPTSYTGPFMTNRTAAEARAYLGIGAGISTNGTNTWTGTNIFPNAQFNTNGVSATNLSVYSSGTTNRPLRVFGTNGESVYVDKDGQVFLTRPGFASIIGPSGSSVAVGAPGGNVYLGNSSVFGASATISDAGWKILSAAYYGFSSDSTSFGTPDITLFRDSIGTLAQRNGAANPQTNRLYHTYSDTSNGQWLEMRTSTNAVTIAAMTQGTGADNININLLPAGTGGVVIGSAGTGITNIVSATATLNFGSILAAASEDLTITATGAVVNDAVVFGPPATMLAGAIFNAWVTSANTVTVRCNNAGSIAIDPASATYRVTVISH